MSNDLDVYISNLGSLYVSDNVKRVAGVTRMTKVKIKGAKITDENI